MAYNKRSRRSNRAGRKHCPGCCEQGQTLSVDAFPKNRSKVDGRDHLCRECRNSNSAKVRAKHSDKQAVEDEKIVREAAARARRLASDHDALKVDDFDPVSQYDVSVANDARDRVTSAQAVNEKKQEWNRHMGANADALRRAARAQSRGGGHVLDNMPGESGDYIGKLSEQERRFGNRRIARSVSLAQAHEALAIRHFRMVADQCFSAKIVPTGYAKAPARGKMRRSVCLLLSDLHLGSDLSSLDEPMPFRAVEEARRLEYVMRQAIDYKPQYRRDSELVLLLNGDLIEGLLLHELRGGAPLTEQKAIFWHLMSRFVGECSRAFPGVSIHCQPGNHGRDKVRHPGRATSRKWDGHEWEMYYALRAMCSELKNVQWSIPFRAVSVVDLHGSKLGLAHGDTEVKIGHPDTKAKNNARELDRVNSTRLHGVEFDAWAFGHYHTPRYHPGNPRVVYNGALVPPNAYARAEGHIGEPCGQFLWEAVEGFPIGDLRFIDVGPAQDRDEKLGTILTPFRFPDDE